MADLIAVLEAKAKKLKADKNRTKPRLRLSLADLPELKEARYGDKIKLSISGIVTGIITPIMYDSDGNEQDALPEYTISITKIEKVDEQKPKKEKQNNESAVKLNPKQDLTGAITAARKFLKTLGEISE